jgi:membrane associated rhomboid family serine protease
MFRSIPTVVKNLLIINVIVFLATMLLQKKGIDLTDLFGLHYYQASLFKPWQFVTYLFMHGGWQHLFFNMFGLFMFGPLLEDRWGPKRFLIYYIVTGFGAALAQYAVIYFQNADMLKHIQELYDQSRNYVEQSEYAEYRKAFLNKDVIVGASGSLFGILIAFGMRYPNMELLILFFPMSVKAKYLVTVYAAIELFSGLAGRAGDNVAHFAHLGGMLFGFILLTVWRKQYF